MNWYKKSQMEIKKNYIANCVDALTNDIFTDLIAQDATEMAQLIDNGKKVTQQYFFDKCEVVVPDPKLIKQFPRRFQYAENKNLMWIYDTSEDIHYFYL